MLMAKVIVSRLAFGCATFLIEPRIKTKRGLKIKEICFDASYSCEAVKREKRESTFFCHYTQH